MNLDSVLAFVYWGVIHAVVDRLSELTKQGNLTLPIELTYYDEEDKVFYHGHWEGAKMKTGDPVVPGEEISAKYPITVHATDKLENVVEFTLERPTPV